MKTKKPVNKYTELLALSNTKDSRYGNQIFINDDLKFIACTDAKRMTASRELYPETKAIARVIGAETDMVMFNPETNVLEATGKGAPSDYPKLIPTDEQLTEYKCVRVKLPDWIKKVSKNAIVPVSLVLGDDPVLAVGEAHNSSVCFNANFLRDIVGIYVNIYVHPDRSTNKPIVIMNEGESSIEKATWFSILMGIRPNHYNQCHYVKD